MLLQLQKMFEICEDSLSICGSLLAVPDELSSPRQSFLFGMSYTLGLFFFSFLNNTVQTRFQDICTNYMRPKITKWRHCWKTLFHKSFHKKKNCNFWFFLRKHLSALFVLHLLNCNNQFVIIRWRQVTVFSWYTNQVRFRFHWNNNGKNNSIPLRSCYTLHWGILLGKGNGVETAEQRKHDKNGTFTFLG